MTHASAGSRPRPPPSTASAMPTRSKRCAVRATAPDTTIPAAPIAMYVTGSQADAVGVEEHRVGDDAQERGHRAEHQGLGGQPRDGAAAGRGGPVTAASCRPRSRARSRTIATSAAMIPLRQRRSIGEQLLEQRLVDPEQGRRLERRHRRGARLGHERRQLADRRPGTELRDGRVAVVDPQPAAHDGEQVLLDRALGDDDLRPPRPRPPSPVGPGPPASGRGRRRTGRRAGARRRARPWSSSCAASRRGRRRAASSSARERAQPGPGVQLAGDHDHVDLAARRRSRCSARRGGSRRSSRPAPTAAAATARSRRRVGRPGPGPVGTYTNDGDEPAATSTSPASMVARPTSAKAAARSRSAVVRAMLGQPPKELVRLGPGAIERLGREEPTLLGGRARSRCRRPSRVGRASAGSSAATAAATSSANRGRSSGRSSWICDRRRSRGRGREAAARRTGRRTTG